MSGKAFVSLAFMSFLASAALPTAGARAQAPGPLVLPGAVPPAAESPDVRSPPARSPARSAPPRSGESAPAVPLPGGAQAPAPHAQTPQTQAPAAQVPPLLPGGAAGETFYFAGDPSPGGSALRIVDHGPGAVGLRLRAGGRAISAPGEQCIIDLGADTPVPMLPIEEPYRNSRYRLQAPVCPLVVEVLEHSVRVSLPDGECSFAQADCRLSPEGLWGPAGETLAGRTAAIERQRGRAEREMRDVSRNLLRRLSGDAQREAAAEQAAFSSERTTVCRHYVGEDQHGFCAAELTSARVDTLRKRYELTPPRPARNR